ERHRARPGRDRAPRRAARRHHPHRERARARHARAGAAAGRRPGAPRVIAMARILIADDEESIRMVLATALTQAGHDVDTVATGGDALNALTGGDFDVAILDIRMPDLSGL